MTQPILKSDMIIVVLNGILGAQTRILLALDDNHYKVFKISNPNIYICRMRDIEHKRMKTLLIDLNGLNPTNIQNKMRPFLSEDYKVVYLKKANLL